ncbi:hypothetical protein [Alicyclobacillus pomorum]|uniref:hypothetical protein n=1 Tax=Alicyclobacillus pomorum TaxID=204470 RepID=UPI00041C78B2|nr:hypothetical protein [Alicyclobacillus pomorum]
MGIHIERVTTMDGCKKCQYLASTVWGGDAACSTAQMIVHATYGGVVLLAYDEHTPIGFLFSFPAKYREEWVLWSHETAVLPAYLHRGIGQSLKETQRSTARELGYGTIAWTFDPLVARNAYFNLHKLGARIVEYKRNVYGSDMADQINRGMETDRFVALWDTMDGSTVTARNLVHSHFEAISVLTTSHSGAPILTDSWPKSTEHLTTDVPLDFTQLILHDARRAEEWRLSFRAAAEQLMEVGYTPAVLQRHADKATYIWIKEEPQS